MANLYRIDAHHSTDEAYNKMFYVVANSGDTAIGILYDMENIDSEYILDCNLIALEVASGQFPRFIP